MDLELKNNQNTTIMTNLLEGFVLLDGLMNACKFVIVNILYTDSKAIALEHYYSLYALSTMDRYLIYILLYCIFLLCDSLLTVFPALLNVNRDLYTYITCVSYYLLTIPVLQNKLLEIAFIKQFVTRLLNNKEIFIKFTISKLIINHLKTISPTLKNYHILILYQHIEYNFVYTFLKSIVLVHLLHTLRQYHVTYYYYKAIKLAYYYSSGYMFNVISTQDSIHIINIIIKERRWKDFIKTDVINALYTACLRNTDLQNTTTQCLWYLSYFYTVWSFTCFLKLFNPVYLVYLVVIPSVFCRKMLLTVLSCYVLILIKTNDLVISLLFCGRQPFWFIFRELLFFIRNKRDIKQVLTYFKNKYC